MEKKTANLLLILFFCFFSFSCSDDSKKTSTALAPELQESFNEATALDNDINRRLVLKNVDNKTQRSLKFYLMELKAKQKYLSRYPKDQRQFNLTLDLIRQIQDLKLPLAAKVRIDQYLSKLYFGVSLLANNNKVKLLQMNNTLFATNFHSGLAPFSTYSSDKVWTKQDGNSVNPNTYASAKASPFATNKSWLVSPQFDFSQLNQAQLSIHHSLIINRGDGVYNINKIRNLGFKILYSIDYNQEDPSQLCYYSPALFETGTNEEVNCNEGSTWTELKFDKPSGDDFHTITTRPIDLSPLLGQKKVHIALLLNFDEDMQKIIGKHFNSWTVYDFTLKGSGFMPEPVMAPLPKVPLFTYDFENKKLKGLLQHQTIDDDFAKWVQGSYRSEGFAKAQTSKDTQESYESFLIHPDIKLSEFKAEALYLNLRQTINPSLDTYNVWERLELLISTDYQKGQNPSEATWQSLNIVHEDELDIKAFNSRDIYNINITSYKNNTVAIAFKFSNNPGENHIWQVSHLEITDEQKD